MKKYKENKEKLTVLMIIDRPYPYTIGGLETYIHNVSNFLLLNDVNVFIISIKTLKNHFGRDFKIKKGQSLNIRRIYYVGPPWELWVRSSRYILPLKIIYRIFYVTLFAFYLFLYILKTKNKNGKIDVMHTQNVWFSGFASVLIGRVLNIPVVITLTGKFGEKMRTIYELKMNKMPKIYKILTMLYSIVEKFVVRHANSIILLGKKNKKYFDNISRNVYIIPNGVDTKRFKPYMSSKIGNNIKIIGFVGRLSKEKGVDVLIKIASLMKKNGYGKRVMLMIIGDGPERENLIRLARKLDVLDIVKFLGFKRNVHDFYKHFDIVIIPSYQEGLPMVMLEAMSSGKIVVASDVGEIKDVIKNGYNGFIVKDRDPEKFFNIIEHVLFGINENDRRRIERNARITVERNFSWDKIIKKIIGIYYKVMKS